MSVTVPIKTLHDAEGHIVTCETVTGEVYRGMLIEAEDNMNCQISDVTATYRDGQTKRLENVFIRGSKIRFLILPDMLKNAPMFKNPEGSGKGKTHGRGGVGGFRGGFQQRGRGNRQEQRPSVGRGRGGGATGGSGGSGNQQYGRGN